MSEIVEQVYRANILELSIESLATRLTQMFDFPCSFLLGDLDRRAQDKIAGKTNYPFGFIKLGGNIRLNEGFNQTATRKHGYRLSIQESGQYWYKFHGINVICELNLSVWFDDQRQLFTFYNNFFIKEAHMSFELEIKNGKVIIQHNVVNEKSLPLPLYEESEYGLIMNIQTTLQLNTLIGDIYLIPIINNIKGKIHRFTREEVTKFSDKNVETVKPTEFFSVSNMRINPEVPVTNV